MKRTVLALALIIALAVAVSAAEVTDLGSDLGLCADYFLRPPTSSFGGPLNRKEAAACLDKKWHEEGSMSWFGHHSGENVKNLGNLSELVDGLLGRFCIRVSSGEYVCDGELLHELRDALEGRRMFAFFGRLKDVRGDLKQDEDDDEGVEPPKFPAGFVHVRTEMYAWHWAPVRGQSDYFCIDRQYVVRDSPF